MLSRQVGNFSGILTAMQTIETIPLLTHAITHLESHLTAPTSIEAAATLVGYSRYHFSRLVADDEQRFQLQDTSHWLAFVDPVNVTDPHLYYHYCGKNYAYQKLDITRD